MYIHACIYAHTLYICIYTFIHTSAHPMWLITQVLNYIETECKREEIHSCSAIYNLKLGHLYFLYRYIKYQHDQHFCSLYF